MRLAVSLLPLLGLVCFSSPAAAQSDPSETADVPLRGLTAADLRLLDGYLDEGPVVYAMFRRRHDEMPAVSIAMKVRASPDQVLAVVTAPERYADFMPALDQLVVETRSRDQIAYRWRWQLALFQLAGRNVMTAYRGNARRGHRVDVRSTGGDLGTGRMSWRIRPDPANTQHSIVVLSSRLDMREANYLADQMSSGGSSVQRSINVALTMVMMLGTRRRAEGRRRATPDELPALQAPELDIDALAPVLARGDLVMLDLDGDALTRVTVLGRTTTDVARVRRVMVDPAEFGQSLMHGSRARVIERTDDFVRFEWGIPVPLVAVEGVMRLEPSADGPVRVSGESGSLRSGRWVFDTHAFDWGEAVVHGYSRFDPAESARFIRRLIDGDADFSHGLAAATQIMVIRSLRTRATRMAP